MLFIARVSYRALDARAAGAARGAAKHGNARDVAQNTPLVAAAEARVGTSVQDVERARNVAEFGGGDGEAVEAAVRRHREVDPVAQV